MEEKSDKNVTMKILTAHNCNNNNNNNIYFAKTTRDTLYKYIDNCSTL
jgi:hypothetical protein